MCCPYASYDADSVSRPAPALRIPRPIFRLVAEKLATNIPASGYNSLPKPDSLRR